MVTSDTRAIHREKVERCLSTTGMSIKEWCRLNGVPASTMRFWMSEFRREEPELFGASSARMLFDRMAQTGVETLLESEVFRRPRWLF